MDIALGWEFQCGVSMLTLGLIHVFVKMPTYYSGHLCIPILFRTDSGKQYKLKCVFSCFFFTHPSQRDLNRDDKNFPYCVILCMNTLFLSQWLSHATAALIWWHLAWPYELELCSVNKELSLSNAAARSKNYSGAELEGVVKSAVSFALNRQLNLEDLSKPVDEENIKVTMDDFLNALHEIIPAFGASMDDLDRCRYELFDLRSHSFYECMHLSFR